jgi:hypothetical protein
MATVTLDYFIRFGLAKASSLLSRVEAIVLNTGELDLLGMSIVSDTTVVVSTAPECAEPAFLQRTVVLETNAQGDALFPDADALQDATRQLWRSRLNLLVPGVVTADEPVVT